METEFKVRLLFSETVTGKNGKGEWIEIRTELRESGYDAILQVRAYISHDGEVCGNPFYDATHYFEALGWTSSQMVRAAILEADLCYALVIAEMSQTVTLAAVGRTVGRPGDWTVREEEE